MSIIPEKLTIHQLRCRVMTLCIAAIQGNANLYNKKDIAINRVTTQDVILKSTTT